MNCKRIFLFTLVLLLSASLLTAAYAKKKAPLRHPASQTFSKGDMFLTPQVGLYSDAVPFGANFEYALTENIGVGGTFMMWFGSGFHVFMPSVDAAYHFTQLKVDKLDLFAGVGLGYAIVGGNGASGTSDLALEPFAAGRYWFSDKMGVSLRINIGLIGDWTGVSSMLGVVFRI